MADLTKLSSTKVKVFPSAYRGKNSNNKIYDPESRFTTEFNITNILNRLTSKPTFAFPVDGTKVECSIHGYWFQLNFDGYNFNNADDIWVYINIVDKNSEAASDTGNILYAAKSLSPVNGSNVDTLDDNNNLFIGLGLSDSEPSNVENDYKLHLLEKDDNSAFGYKVPTSSLFKFYSADIANSTDLTEDKAIDVRFNTSELVAGDAQITSLGNTSNEVRVVIAGSAGSLENKSFYLQDIFSSHPDDNSNIYVISSFARESDGDINASLKSLRGASSSQAGIITTTDQTFSGVKEFASGVISPTYTLGSSTISINPIEIKFRQNQSLIQVYSKGYESLTSGNIFYRLPDYDTSPTTSNKTYTLATTSVTDTKIPLAGSNRITGSLTPSSSASPNLGTSSDRWNYIYGNIIDASSYFNVSDERLKENIKEFKYDRSILDISVKSFDYKNGEKNQIGFIAQDLQKLYPELVKENDKGYLSIQENKLIYLLMEEVRKLKDEIKSLKGE